MKLERPVFMHGLSSASKHDIIQEICRVVQITKPPRFGLKNMSWAGPIISGQRWFNGSIGTEMVQ